jgi:hypothetical protein
MAASAALAKGAPGDEAVKFSEIERSARLDYRGLFFSEIVFD